MTIKSKLKKTAKVVPQVIKEIWKDAGKKPAPDNPIVLQVDGVITGASFHDESVSLLDQLLVRGTIIYAGAVLTLCGTSVVASAAASAPVSAPIAAAGGACIGVGTCAVVYGATKQD